MEFDLAQINIGKILAPINDPVMADFVANLDQINSPAEKSGGFVWRLDHLRKHGETPFSFSFKKGYTVEEMKTSDLPVLGSCLNRD